jgi:hypothetical protein
MTDNQDAPPHEHAPFGGAIGGGPECLLCPICVLLQAMTSTRPEVTRHLLAAAKELTQALQAIVDAQASAHDTAGDRLERIDVE